MPWLVFGLVLERLTRPASPGPFKLRSLLVIIAVTVIGVWMVVAYGPWQGVGEAIGAMFLFAAVRQHRPARGVLASLALIVLGLTALGTQTPYQYARRHADEIVAAGCELMDGCGRGRDDRWIQPDDPRVPKRFEDCGQHAKSWLAKNVSRSTRRGSLPQNSRFTAALQKRSTPFGSGREVRAVAIIEYRTRSG